MSKCDQNHNCFVFFMAILSITVSTSLNVQWCLMSWLLSFLVESHLSVIYFLSFCMCSSVCCILYIFYQHTCWCVRCNPGYISAQFHTSYFFIFPLKILLPWEPVWYKYIDPWFVELCILYWCFVSMMCCSCYDSIATSFLNIATKGLWSVITWTSLAKQ